MSRIQHCLEKLRAENKKALVPYIVCGDPELSATLSIMNALVNAGANIIELGVPFSDPMAEGPVIQKAHERSLLHNTSLKNTLNIVKEFRRSNDTTPVVLMGYANPIERMGYENFAQAAVAAGVDGVLTVDLPPEEAGLLNQALKKVKIDNIFLLAPTTTMDRAQTICEMATGYLYYVSLKGVTGAGHLDITEVVEKLDQFRKFTSLPICVGFGIKDAESAANIARVADGAVVGSVLVNAMAELQKEGKSFETMALEVSTIVRSMRQAIDKL